MALSSLKFSSRSGRAFFSSISLAWHVSRLKFDPLNASFYSADTVVVETVYEVVTTQCAVHIYQLVGSMT